MYKKKLSKELQLVSCMDLLHLCFDGEMKNLALNYVKPQGWVMINV